MEENKQADLYILEEKINNIEVEKTDDVQIEDEPDLSISNFLTLNLDLNEHFDNQEEQNMEDNNQEMEENKDKDKDKEEKKSVLDHNEHNGMEVNKEENKEVKPCLQKSVEEITSTYKRLTRKRNHQKSSEIDDNSLKNTPRNTRAKAKPVVEIKKKTPKRPIKAHPKTPKENSISSISHSSLKKPVVTTKFKSTSSNKEKVSKASSELQKIALIRTKLDNVLKEKFTSIDLVAQENSNKIFDDFAYLSSLEIDIKSL
jgi:hypothetical protein